MFVIFISLILFLLTLKLEQALWLAFPLGLFWDLWTLRPLGVSVFFLLAGWLIFRTIFESIPQNGPIQS